MLIKIRADKFLWSVRLFKTRPLSNEACSKSKVKINNNTIKSSYIIKVGDVITIKKKLINITIKVKDILNEQNVKYDDRVVAEVINNHFPDWRRVLNELQRYSVSGTIDAGILVDISEINIKELIHSMKNKEFTNVRKWVVDSLDNDPVRLLRSIYDHMYDYVDGSSIPHLVVVLGEYQYKSAFVADQEINMLACLTEIMARGKFK